MAQRTILQAKEIFQKELKQQNSPALLTPQQCADVLDACLERTYKQVRNGCLGDTVRINACDTLFKEARESVNLLSASLNAAVVPSVTQQAAPATDVIQLALLMAGALLAVLSCGSVKIFSVLLGAAAAVCVIAALLREARRQALDGALIGMACKALRKFKRKKAAEELEKRYAKPAQTVLQSAPALQLKVADLAAACIRQMKIIDENLGLFSSEGQAKDQNHTLLPLVRTLLAEQYADRKAVPASVQKETEQYLRANGLRTVDYDSAHGHLFVIQSMDETFTMYPAILDEKGKLLERGMAGVKEA